jgi:hypothetical protein
LCGLIKRNPVDEHHDVGAAVASALNNRELIDYQPVIVGWFFVVDELHPIPGELAARRLLRARRWKVNPPKALATLACQWHTIPGTLVSATQPNAPWWLQVEAECFVVLNPDTAHAKPVRAKMLIQNS